MGTHGLTTKKIEFGGNDEDDWMDDCKSTNQDESRVTALWQTENIESIEKLAWGKAKTHLSKVGFSFDDACWLKMITLTEIGAVMELWNNIWMKEAKRYLWKPSE